MNSKTARELRRISESIPQEMLDRLIVEKEAMSTTKDLLKKAIKDKSVPKEKRDKFKNVLDSGYLNFTEKVSDPEVEKEIEEWVDNQIEIAIRNGRVPDPKTDKELQKYIKKAKRWTKNREKSKSKTSKETSDGK